LIRGEYDANFKLWAKCIEEPTAKLVKVCQRDAVKHLVANSGKFTPDAHMVKTRKPGSKVSFIKVRKLEAYMLAFRDYANLVIMELTPILQYYCIGEKDIEHASHYCDSYSNQMESEVKSYIEYAKKAIALIKEGHWGTNRAGNCPNTVTCDPVKEVDEGDWIFTAHTVNTQTCRCEIESSNTKQYCEMDYTMRVDNKPVAYTIFNYRECGHEDWACARRIYSKGKLDEFAKEYQIANHKVMNKYWKNEIESFLPKWQEAVEIAKMMRGKNPKKAGDAPSMDFSEGFAERLAKSGYVAVQDTPESIEEADEN